MQYNYHQELDEFIENPTGDEQESVTGNRVFVTVDDEEGTLRFRIEIDDHPHVLAALNRLIQMHIPTFVFPQTKTGLCTPR